MGSYHAARQNAYPPEGCINLKRIQAYSMFIYMVIDVHACGVFYRLSPPYKSSKFIFCYFGRIERSCVYIYMDDININVYMALR